MRKNIVFIGAGNVATHLSRALLENGFLIQQVFSRDIKNAKSLAQKLKFSSAMTCRFTSDIKSIAKDADVYFFSVPDDVLPAIIAEMPANDGLWVHTSGSVPLRVFRGYIKRYGVLYPLQTFSKQRCIDFSHVPLLIEANSADDRELLNRIAACLSDRVINMTSNKRKHLHLAAVFACNFSNHLYAIASDILKKQRIDWRLLQPLIDETAGKLYDMPPVEAQTGPAVRGDKAIMERHLSMLEDKQIRQLYALLSENIQIRHKIKKEHV